jgi:hypothetical protein
MDAAVLFSKGAEARFAYKSHLSLLKLFLLSAVEYSA